MGSWGRKNFRFGILDWYKDAIFEVLCDVKSQDSGLTCWESGCLLLELIVNPMRCPKCHTLEDRVIDSRMSKEGDSIRRRRECLSCETRFTTYEQLERIELRVLKRDGRHEIFERKKLLTSFEKACEKRAISMEVIDECMDQIVREIELENPREITTRLVGLKVMEKLQVIDPVAYVRYASVYRRFQEIGDFLEEIQTMEKKGVWGQEGEKEESEK